MNAEQQDLDQLINQYLAQGGFNVAGGRGLFMEVKDTKTNQVWMSSSPVQITDFEALELDESLTKVGIAQAPMDRAAFRYSPGAPNEPVRERIINGRHYINVAVPMDMIPPKQPGGPLEISVDKAHVIGFKAGRTIAILSLPEGDFVELVGDADNDDALVLPANGSLSKLQLTQPWVVSLPTPTRTFFWFEDGMRSFQGPVTLPQKT